MPPVPTVEVKGEANAMANRAAKILLTGNQYTLSPIKVLEKADDHIRFESVAGGVVNQRAGLWFRQGELRFRPFGFGGTQIHWAVETMNMRCCYGSAPCFRWLAC